MLFRNESKSYKELKNDIERLDRALNDKIALIRDIQATHERNIENLEHRHKIEMEKMTSKHLLEMEQKNFDVLHSKDEELKAVHDKVTAAEKRVAVLEYENKMLNEITDMNKDIIDIKDLVKNLI